MSIKTLVLLVAFAGLTVPAQAQPATARKVELGGAFFLILMSDGIVWGMGACDHGELWPLNAGPCTEIRSPRPMTLPARVTDIAAAERAAFVLLDDGRVLSWGEDLDGQLGTGPRYEYGRNRPARREPTIVAGLRDVVQIDAAAQTVAALTAEGRVVWWGARPIDGPNQTSATPVPIDGLPPIAAISLSATHLLARSRDGALYAIGRNRRGQLGNGTTTASATPVRTMTPLPVTAACAANEHSAAVLADGSVHVWGTKLGGNGPGSTRAVDDPDGGIDRTPVAVAGVAGAERISCINGTVGVVLKDRTLRLWGYDGWGEVGIGRPGGSEFQPLPKRPALTDVADLFQAGSRTFAVTNDGRLYFWGAGNSSYPEPLKTMKTTPTPWSIGSQP